MNSIEGIEKLRCNTLLSVAGIASIDEAASLLVVFLGEKMKHMYCAYSRYL